MAEHFDPRLRILQLLATHGEMYGLDMIRQDDRLKMGTIYLHLGRLEDEGKVTGRKEDPKSPSQLQRRLYTITDVGRKARVDAIHHAAPAGVIQPFPGSAALRRSAPTESEV